MCILQHSFAERHQHVLILHHNGRLVVRLPNLLPAGGSNAGKVGDGGASWRLKALARAKAQAGDALDPNFGRRIGDIVSEQWGSLSELTAGLQNARAAHGGLLVFSALHSVTLCCVKGCLQRLLGSVTHCRSCLFCIMVLRT